MSRPDRPNVNVPAVQPGNVVISTPSWAQPTARTAAPENRAGCCGGACHSGSETDPAEQVGNLKLTRRLTPEEAELLRESGPAADISTEADEQARREGASCSSGWLSAVCSPASRRSRHLCCCLASGLRSRRT